MPEDIRRALIGVEITELFGEEGVIGQLKEVRFTQKLPALDSLAKYLGMFHDGAVAGPGLHISLPWVRNQASPNPRSNCRGHLSVHAI